MTEPNWWDDRTMPNDGGPDWSRDENGVLWQVDSKSGERIKGHAQCGCQIFPSGLMARPCPPHEAEYAQRETEDEIDDE